MGLSGKNQKIGKPMIEYVMYVVGSVGRGTSMSDYLNNINLLRY